MFHWVRTNKHYLTYSFIKQVVPYAIHKQSKCGRSRFRQFSRWYDPMAQNDQFLKNYSVCHSTDLSMVAKNRQSNHVRESIVPRINLEDDAVLRFHKLEHRSIGTSVIGQKQQAKTRWYFFVMGDHAKHDRHEPNKSKSSDILLEREPINGKPFCGQGMLPSFNSSLRNWTSI